MELGRSGADADVGFRRFGAAADSTPVERSGSYGVIDNDRQILQQLRWGARLRSRRAAPGAALNDQQNLAALTWFAALTRARARLGGAMPSLICSTRSMGLVGASEACRGFDGEVGGGAVVDFFFVISIRGRRGSSVIGSTCAGRRCGCRPTSTSSF